MTSEGRGPSSTQAHDWLRSRDRSGYDCLRCEARHDGEWRDDAHAQEGECEGVEPPVCDCGREYGTTLIFGHDVRCALRVAYFGGPHD